jgi:hypothetical protein
MTVRARLPLGLSAAALVAGALLAWSTGRGIRSASPAQPVAAAPAVPASPAASAASAPALARPEEARPKPERRWEPGQTVAPELVAPQAPADSLGRLRVHVRSLETGEPLGGVRLLFEPMAAERGAITLVEGPRARPGQSPVTDDQGFAEFEVPFGVVGRLAAGRGQTVLREETFVMPFTEPEVRDVVLELPTRSIPRFFGRVISLQTDAPLSGARISIAHGLVELSADSEGYFEALFQAQQPVPVTVVSPGHGLAITSIDRGHESRDDALVIRLSESAHLNALAVARDGTPLEGVRVRLTTKPWHVAQSMGPEVWARLDDLEWSCRTGPDGRCSIELPAFTPLALEYEKEGLFERSESDPITLDPGEVREVVCHIGSGAAIAGRLMEEGGEGIEGVELWLVPAEADVPRYLRSYDEPAASTTTDRTGRFELTDVAEGAWWVGPAPGGAFPTRAEVVDVAGGVADRELLLVVPRDLFIEGHVVDDSGAPLARVHVSLTKEGEQVWVDDETDEDGLFAIGPVARGTFDLRAWSALTDHVRSGAIPVAAGDDEVRVELHLGGRLAGKLVGEATGLPVRGQVLLTVAGDGDSIWSWSWPDEAGKFEFTGLEAGLYNLAASTDRQEFVFQEGILVEAGAAPTEVELEARPGATLRLRYEGDQTRAGFSVRLGEVIVAAGHIERGTWSSTVVPAAVPVECHLGGEEPEVHELTLAVGEERELLLGRVE